MSLVTRKVKRPRKRRKTKTKTKTADAVVEAQEQAMHRQEKESRWAAGVQAAKKEFEARMLQLEEEMAQVYVNKDARTQQEEDSRRAAVKKRVTKEEGVHAMYGAGREFCVGFVVRWKIFDFSWSRRRRRMMH